MVLQIYARAEELGRLGLALHTMLIRDIESFRHNSLRYLHNKYEREMEYRSAYLALVEMDKTWDSSPATLTRNRMREDDEYKAMCHTMYSLVFDELTMAAQWSLCIYICQDDEILACALSLLCCDYPIQLCISDYTLYWLAEHAIDVKHRHKLEDARIRDVDTHKLFEVKKDHPGAVRKVNLFFSHVWADVRRHFPGVYRTVCMYSDDIIKLNLYNDQATAALIHYVALAESHYMIRDRLNYPYSFYAVSDRDGCKSLTTAIKSLGANSTKLGSMLCELQSMIGRGVSPVDWDKDMLPRLRGSKDSKAIHVPLDKLRNAVEQIIRDELNLDKMRLEDYDTYWSKRWQWCVNGAHNRYVEDAEPAFNTDQPWEYGSQTRRVFSERIKVNPLCSWSGVTYATTAQKLEHGKSRALYSCDSITYFVFNYLLSSVENAWENKRVILDPGKKGTTGMVNYIANLQSRGNVNIMLDYDDFNSQHTLEAQAIVIQCLGEYFNLEPSLLKKMVNSFNNIHVIHQGHLMGRLGSTLMSGHRGTSLLNSILNSAYLRIYLRDYERYDCLHVGDDVYISCSDFNDADNIMSAIQSSPLRINRMKQSIGTQCGEFLRCAITSQYCRGYVARSIASTVSGNWESDAPLDELNYTTSLVGASWTLKNRSHPHIYLTLVSSLQHRCTLAKDDIIKLLNHEVSLNHGPIQQRSYYIHTTSMKRREEDELETNRYSKFALEKADNATKSYLTTHVSEVELEALNSIRVSPTNAMLQASYEKSLRACMAQEIQFTSATTRKDVLTYYDVVKDFNRVKYTRDRCGILLKYPIITLYRDRFNESVIRKLTRMVSDDSKPDHVSWVEYAFGVDPSITICTTPVIYSDVQWLSHHTNSPILQLPYLYMM